MKAPWFHIICEMDAESKPAPTIRDIQRAVVRRFAGVTLGDILSSCRTPEVILPRQMAMFLARSILRKTYSTIASAFGDRDHSTICYGVRKIERLAREDYALQRLLASVTAELGCTA
jgi:chromosomal replication initiator protein